MTATHGGKGRPVASESPTVASSGPPTYEPSHVIQCLVEIQKEVSALSAKTERLISDVGKLDDRVDGLRHTLSRAQGFGIAAVLLIPACAAIIWWLIGGQLTEIKNKLYAIPAPPAAASTPPPAANSPSKPG
jgi:hypothetical protein